MSDNSQYTKKSVSVIIVNYNTRETTARCIQSVIENTNPKETEIIVVDNNSTDGSSEYFSNQFPEVFTISSNLNGGFAYGNNLGLEQYSGRYALLLNPDTWVDDDTIPRCVEYMDKNTDIGVLGPKVYLENGRQQSTLFRYLRLQHLIFNWFVPNNLMRNIKQLGDLRYASLDRNKPHDVEIVAGCFMMVRRKTIEESGPMDSRFFMYGEESEWCHRITMKGWKIRYDPRFHITHIGAVSTGQISEWKAIEIAKGQILFFRFTRGVTSAYAATLLLFMRDLLRGMFFIPKAIRRPNDQSVKVWKARLRFVSRCLIFPPKGQSIDHIGNLKKKK